MIGRALGRRPRSESWHAACFGTVHMRSSPIALAAIIVLVSVGRAHGATIGGLWNSQIGRAHV